MSKIQKTKQKDKTIKERVLQWHPAFYASIQIEFEKEADKLTFIREHPLATKPILIDVVIIKKNTDDKLKKNIGRIFKKYNIVEYKSPKDYLSINDFYKVYAYACYYISSSKRVNGISPEDVTITFVAHRYPMKMIKHLEKIRGLEIINTDKGIYYILGDTFPIQLIVTKRLSEENNLWLSSLTDDLKGHSIIDKLSKEYRKNRRNELYKSVMNIIIRANNEQFREEKDMCEAILELFQDEVDRETEKARNEGIKVGRSEGIKVGRNEGINAGISESVVVLLANHGTVTRTLAEKISEEKDITVLKSWVNLAAGVSSIEEFEEKMYRV